MKFEEMILKRTEFDELFGEAHGFDRIPSAPPEAAYAFTVSAITAPARGSIT